MDLSMFCSVFLGLLSLLYGRAHGFGIVHYVNWTISGVSIYQESSLDVEIGDSILFGCANGSYSNLMYHKDEEPFNACDARNYSARLNGFCPGFARNITLEITQSSANLAALTNYRPGSTVYFTSYSEGDNLTSAVTHLSSGGECLNNLKLRVRIVVPTVHPPTIPTTTSTEPTSTESITQSTTVDVILPAVVGGLNGSQSLHSSILTILTGLCTLIILSVT